MSFLSKYALGRPEDLEAFLAYTERRNQGIATGLPTLDRKFLGLQGIVGLVGDTEACKSTLALQVALHNAASGVPVLFVDRENSRTGMWKRIIGHREEVSWQGFKSLTRAERAAAWSRIANCDLRLNCEPFTKDQLTEQIGELCNQPGDQALLVLDSLHKLPNDYDNMRSSIDHWLIYLEEMMQKFDPKLTILVTCEKNRSSYGTANTASPKESGRIEYTLHQQFDMYRCEEERNIKLKCTKNRYGDRGDTVSLKSQLNSHREWIYKLKEEEEIDV